MHSYRRTPIFEFAPTGMVIVDRAGLVVDVNAQCERIFGYPSAQLVGQPVERLIPERHGNGHRSLVAAFFDSPEARLTGHGRHLLGRHASGREFPIEVGLHLMPEGQETYALATVSDITSMEAERAQQALAAAIVASTEDAIVAIAQDGSITAWNDSAARMFGYRRDEAVGRSIAMLAPLTHVAEQSEFIARAVESEQTARYETVRLRKDQVLVDVSVTLSLIRQGGRSVGISFLYKDISQRKTMERALAESEAKYRAIVEDSTDLISLAAPDGRLVFVNDAYARHFGLPAIRMLGKNLLDFVVAEDRAAVAERLASVIDKGIALTSENRMLGADGIERWIEWTNRALIDEVGHRVTIHSLGRDVTDRKRMERALSSSERRYRLLYELSPAMLHSIDPKGRLIDVSNEWLANLGYSRDEVLGRMSTDFLTPESRAYAQKVVFPDVIRTGRCDDVEYRMVRKDGSVIEVLLSAMTELDEEERPVRTLAILTDVTARRKAEEGSRERDAAERASRAKSEFLARMSHELRTPLNAILGFAQLLSSYGKTALPQKQRAQLEQIEIAGWHLLNLVNEVLDISRIETGRLELNIVEVDPLAATLEAIEFERSNAERQGVTLHVHEPAIAARKLKADAIRLRQVLLNLLSNAIKYNKEGGRVDVSISLLDDLRLAITVRDSGIGMTEQQMGHLFEPFARLGMEKSKIQGVGMGLVVSRLLVEHMGGRIRVESRPNEGSVFEVDLPVSNSEVA
jgi:PAS domain S-box-containing protein